MSAASPDRQHLARFYGHSNEGTCVVSSAVEPLLLKDSCTPGIAGSFPIRVLLAATCQTTNGHGPAFICTHTGVLSHNPVRPQW